MSLGRILFIASLFSGLTLAQSPEQFQTPQPPTLKIWKPADSASQTQAQDPSPAAQSQQPPSYANFSIMLVNPAGGAVVLMHNPKNELEFVDVKNAQQAFSAGYVPVRAAELGELISSLRDENTRLAAENTNLRIQVARLVPAEPASPTASKAEIEAQQRQQIEAQKAARRQQLIQSWLMLQNMNRPQTQNFNVNVTDCTRFPALCAGR